METKDSGSYLGDAYSRLTVEQIEEQSDEYEYEYLMQKYRKAIKEHRGTGNVVAELLNKLLDKIFQKNPNWSISRALTRIHNDSGDLGYSKNYLYNFLNEEHRGMIKSTGRKVSNIGNSSSSTFFTETPEQTYERLVQEKAEMEADAQKVSKNYDIDTTKDSPDVDLGHENCLRKDTELRRRIEDKDEQIKRVEKKAKFYREFYKRSEMTFPLRLLQQYYNENDINPSEDDEVIIIQEKGRVVGVRAA